MRPNLILRCVSTVCFTALLGLFYAVPRLLAQGGEPQYFAIRGARVVPVSGPPMENATIVVSRGLITAVGKDIAIPAEAWLVDGKGLVRSEYKQALSDLFETINEKLGESPATGEKLAAAKSSTI